MSIKKNAVKLLTELYNAKNKGKSSFRLKELYEISSFEVKLNFMNAFEYLDENALVKIGDKAIGNDEGFPNYFMIKISARGIDLLENESEFKNQFRGVKIENKDGQIILLNNSSAGNILHNVNKNKGDVVGRDKVDKSTHYYGDHHRTYKIDRVDNGNTKELSKVLINKFGEDKVEISGLIVLATGLINLFLAINSLIPESMTWISFLTFNSNIEGYVLGFAIILLAIGGWLFSLVRFKHESQCPECEKHWAMEEIGEPTATDIQLHNGDLKRTINRLYECVFCGFNKPTEATYTVTKEELEKGKD